MSSLPSFTAGAEPILHLAEANAQGRRVGCVCLHGLTASPDEVRWLARALHQRGISAYAPRMNAHGVGYRDMARVQWQDWYYNALDGYHLLRQTCDQVYVAGLSMGGLIALLLASAVPLDGVIVMASPILLKPTQPPIDLAHLIAPLMPYTYQPDVSALPTRIRAEQIRRGFPNVGRVRYDQWATRAVAAFHTITLLAHDALPNIHAPLLAIYSRGDQTVLTENLDLIARTVKSNIVETHLLTDSDHILTQDSECDAVFALVGDFIARHSMA
jgi:carboxylesterase